MVHKEEALAPTDWVDSQSGANAWCTAYPLKQGTSPHFLSMPSDRKKAKAKATKAKAVAKVQGKASDEDVESDQTSLKESPSTSSFTNGVAASEEISDRSCTGVLASHPQSRDIHIDSFSLLFHGHELLQDTFLELNYGRRYGLLGLNGCGKSCLLKALAAREVPIPEHIDMYLLEKEIPASDMTALEVCTSLSMTLTCCPACRHAASGMSVARSP